MSEQNGLQVINGVECFIDENGIVQLKLENVARGLGFTTVATSGNEVVRWTRVDKYLEDAQFATNGERPEYIPEPIFYLLAMKANNEVAKSFQNIVAYEILPTIRKTGTYTAKPLSQLEILQGSIELLAQQDKRIEKLETKIDTALARPVLEDWRSWANNTINSIVSKAGLHYQTFRHELYVELENTARCNLTARVNRLKERLKKAGYKYKDCQAVTKIHVIEEDPKLKAIFEGIIKRESAREA